MFGKLGCLFVVIALTTIISFSQNSVEKVSTQTDKQKVAVVVPSAAVDERVSLIEGKVTLVYDGDNISVETKDNKIYSIRLKGIDAPENKQNYGKKSRKNLAEMIEGKEVKVLIHKKGLYDRYLGTVYFNGEDIGLKQIEAGMAWHYKQFGYEQTADERRKYAQAQATAQSARLGLWEDKEPVAPWDFRKEKNTAENGKKDLNEEAASNSNTSNVSETNNTADRKYILGPRGGCYYVSESGKKVYVKDKSLCAKP